MSRRIAWRIQSLAEGDLSERARRRADVLVARDDGFEYDGEVFRSLSAIAKMITGSHWNGLLFFKIAKPKAAKVVDAAKRKNAPAGRNGEPKRRRETVNA